MAIWFFQLARTGDRPEFGFSRFVGLGGVLSKDEMMGFFRFVWLNGFIALYSIVMCCWGLLISLFDRRGGRIHRLAAVPWAKGILWASGVRVQISGKENVPRDRPHIYMTNHQSYFDILGLLAVLPTDFKFIMKQELMRIPLLGLAMRRTGYIGIEREEPRKAVRSIKEAARLIREGNCVVIFPEGTRSPDGNLLPFKRGGFHLALESRCDIVPVGIRNSRTIVPKGSLTVRKGSFQIRIGQPIAVKGYDRKNVGELMERVRKAVEKNLFCDEKEEGSLHEITESTTEESYP